MSGRPLRFYLASAFELAQKVQGIAECLEERGHLVPVRWWDLEGEAHKKKTALITEAAFYQSRAVQATAARNFGGVASCDALILVTDGPARKFNGAAVELGYALAHGKPCYAYGQLDRSAMFAHVRHGLTLPQIIEEVEGA